MSGGDVTRDGLRGVRPDRDAMTGNLDGERRKPGRRRRGRAEQQMVPDAEFTSYYGRPVIKAPVWEAPDIPGYIFLGGLAGASSMLAAGADLSGRGELAKVCKVASLGAISLSALALVHDLGKPSRFLNMLRTLKVTSPMSVGSWLLAAYGPATGVAALSSVTGFLPPLGAAATAGAAALGGPVAAYTGVLLADTAVPAWHGGYREMPFVFTGSGAAAAAGLALGLADHGIPMRQLGPARAFGVLGAALELVASEAMEKRLGLVAEPYQKGNKGAYYVKAGKALTALGAVGAVASMRAAPLTRAAGAALFLGSLATKWGIFHAGFASADDPKYTVVPQRDRIERGEQARATAD